jgi:flagellar biosynthesis GTPase FlhF
MSLCRSSKVFLGLAVVSAGALMFADQISQATGYAHVTLVSQLAVGVCLFAAMLLHMRFVSHVNPNPPEPKALRETPNTTSRREEEFSSPAAVAEKPSKKTSTKQSRKRQVVAHAMDDFDEFEEEEEAPQPRRRKRTRREGPAPDSLKGMTKKERKMARKAFREEQRAMERGYDN